MADLSPGLAADARVSDHARSVSKGRLGFELARHLHTDAHTHAGLGNTQARHRWYPDVSPEHTIILTLGKHRGQRYK